MTEETILARINELIEEENGEAIDANTPIIDSGVDSFGITMVFVELDTEYGVYPKEEFKNIQFETITPADVIDKVMSKYGSK